MIFLLAYLVRNNADSLGFEIRNFPGIYVPSLAHAQDLIMRTGGLKEVIREIKEGIKRLLKPLTMKYYYRFIKPKIPIPHKACSNVNLILDIQQLLPNMFANTFTLTFHNLLYMLPH